MTSIAPNDSEIRRWLPQRRPSRLARVRLLCFPYAGGSSGVFANWQKALEPEIEVCAVQLPGRGGRLKEMPHRRVDTLVPLVLNALAPLLSDLPLAIFGHSMGALLALETARAVKGRGRVVRLFASARRAPHRPDREVPMTGASDEEFLRRLRLMNGTPPEVLRDKELMQVLLPVLRADLEINDSYAFQVPPLDIPVTALGAVDDPKASIDELMGWAEITTGPFHVVVFPGDHFFLHAFESAMLDVIRDELARPYGNRPPVD